MYQDLSAVLIIVYFNSRSSLKLIATFTEMGHIGYITLLLQFQILAFRRRVLIFSLFVHMQLQQKIGKVNNLIDLIVNIYYNMKAYRQANIKHQNNHRNFRKSNKYKQSDKARKTLRQLVCNYQLKEISLNCNKSINIVEKALLTEYRHNVKRQEQYIQIYAGRGENNILKSCFEAYDNNNRNQTYLFVANPKITSNISSEQQQIQETSFFSQNINFQNQQEAKKQCSKVYGRELQSNNKLIQNKIRQNSNMFMVEQRPSQYNQSQIQQILTFRQQFDKQRKNKSNVQAINYLQISEIPIETKKSILQIQKETALIKQDRGQIVQQEGTQKYIHKQETIRFSQIITNGYIQCSSLSNLQKQSFQLVGDQEIQNQKLTNKQLPLYQIRSILKPHNQNLTQECIFLPRQNISLSNNQNIKKQQIHRQQKQINKVDTLEAQNEKQMNDFLQITQKIVENRSQFHVKYNIRFVDKKSPTGVVRVSPFKFRKTDSISNKSVQKQPPSVTKISLVNNC